MPEQFELDLEDTDDLYESFFPEEDDGIIDQKGVVGRYVFVEEEEDHDT